MAARRRTRVGERGHAAGRVGQLAKGATVTVIEAPGRWVRIAMADGTTGWVSSRYLRPQ